MTTKKIYLLTIILLFFTSFTFSQKFDISPISKWVKEVKMPASSEVSKYDVNGGAYSTLIDYQSNLTNYQTYTHVGLNILSNSGVDNASQLLIEYDSSYTEIKFHYLYVWRKGKKIDKTNELSFETLNNEANLSSNIYSGKITAYDILEDIRVGDKIEYAYTEIGQNPIYKNMHFKLVPLLEDNPIDLLSYTIIHKDNESFISKCNDCENYKISNSTNKGIKTTTLTAKNIAASDIEGNLPPGHFPFPHFTVTNTKTWKEVNDWAMKVFALEKTPNFKNVYNEIFSGGETRDQKITAIIDYVQNDIRYMGIESGIGSIKPFHPHQVIKQRYGDCKDKSLLLACLLNDIGIKNSYPVLVSSELLAGVNKLYPSGKLFDHCITYFEIDNKEYWIDPTFTLQGGDYKTRFVPDYKLGLVISEQTTGLKSINNSHKKSFIVKKEIIKIDSYDSDGEYKIITNFFGIKADYLRNTLETVSRKDLSEQLKISHSVNFPNITTKELVKITDNKEVNQIQLIEDYTIDKYWNKKFVDKQLYHVFNYQPNDVLSYISAINCEPRKYPIAVAHSNIYKQISIFHIPSPIKMEVDSKTYANDAFNFDYVISPINQKTVKIEYNFKSNADEIPAQSFLKACNQSNEITENVAIYISIPVLD